MVEEAICYGWIDSTVNILDDARGLQLLTPRKPKSTWTRLNRRRVAAMETAGFMTDAGRRAVERAKENGWWTILDPVEDLIEPADLAAALDANGEARIRWDDFPPSARKAMLWWVISAARDDTRARRIATIVERAARGERARGVPPALTAGGHGGRARIRPGCYPAALPRGWCPPSIFRAIGY